ncbi:MAG TPA: M23 family metallopeptidase, partial [Flavobacteriaceae bacterium]|nr:M23 family metallopeptidase [Flavobacteriaceae bacterium]
KMSRMHNGIDFSANNGANIYATADGVVSKASNQRGYGKIVTIDHGFGFETRYAHMSKMNVRRGQKVTRGQVIGQVGNTGLSTAPHVHYEIRKNGRTVNPINYFHGDLSAEEYNILLERSSLENQSMD